MNKTLTLSQAVKLYTGSSIGRLTVKFTGLLFAQTCLTTLIFAVIGWAEGKTDRISDFVSLIFLVSLMLAHMFLLGGHLFPRSVPGGKFFRSTKEGFAGYQKMRTGVLLVSILILVLSFGGMYLLNMAVPIGTNAAAYVILLIVSLYMISFLNFLQMLPNEGLANILRITALTLTGIFSAGLFTVQRVAWWHWLAGVVALLLVPLSHLILLRHYRKYFWNT